MKDTDATVEEWLEYHIARSGDLELRPVPNDDYTEEVEIEGESS